MAHSRLPETKTLADILPKGTEGGKEFARMVDLLLFHEARRNGRTINIFSDVSGDYRGLDSFGESGVGPRRDGTVGYQYKFFPSPLSRSHRAEIKSSLKKAAGNQDELKLKKWILVTPMDLTESVLRKDGGDVSWFQGLKEKLHLEFEIEAWGHRKLQALFLETPSLCLFYYPELLPEGSSRQRSIHDTRSRYDKNLLARYRHIEFVGMSIYKPENTRGVPIEDIYIPLTLVSEAANSDDPKVQRFNPMDCLAYGVRTVVLGDPGSGKSTLLKCLALVGICESLQKRCQATPDSRLPVLVLLRRYADELTTRPNLPILDYIIECTKADFSLNSADQNFFEYYLESGQTLLLFDGLDELSQSSLKQKVRDRIRSLVTTYPGNTVVVTSRIVGYENSFRFDEKEFYHHRVAKLRLPEIERFVSDWYAVRIEHKSDRDKSATDLIRILANCEHSAIRELASNPLLLTIIALVHRIDAVLPDERVVLYQKCTETLLNTWHTWKFNENQAATRSKAERRNSRRMGAIAYWMQTRAERTSDGQRSVVRFDQLSAFLAAHIHEYDKVADEEEAQDQAAEFLDFVKRRAGLLIEVGDQQYSFVHLTFQEYLTATHIATQTEKEGVKSAWTSYIYPSRRNLAWREVIRLFIASLKSDDSQEFLVEQLLTQTRNELDANGATLLAGLILDGIEAAERVQAEIAKCLLMATPRLDNPVDFRSIVSAWRGCSARNQKTREALQLGFQQAWLELVRHQRLAVLLMLLTSGWSQQDVYEVAGRFLQEGHPETSLLKLIIPIAGNDTHSAVMPVYWEQFVASMQWATGHSATMNLFASALSTVAQSVDTNLTGRTLLRVTLFALRLGIDSTPFSELWRTTALVRLNCSSNTLSGDQFLLKLAASRHPKREWDRDQYQDRDRALSKALDRALEQEQELELDWPRALARGQPGRRARARSRGRTQALHRALHRARTHAGHWDFNPDLTLGQNSHKSTQNELWPTVITDSNFDKLFWDFLCGTLVLRPRVHWEEALRTLFLPSIPDRMDFMDQEFWRAVEHRYESDALQVGDDYFAAWLLLLDSWLWICKAYEKPNESYFVRLAELTCNSFAPPLQLAHCIRDLAYGKESRTNDLVNMVRSLDPVYRRMFEECLWRLTPEEEARGANKI